MGRWYWVNFQCLLIWMKVGQGPTALVIDASGVVWTFFSCLSFLSSFCLCLGDGPIWTEILHGGESRDIFNVYLDRT